MNKSIVDYVLKLGVKPNTKGFYYLLDAIEISINNTGTRLKMFEEIYNVLGKKYNDNPLYVERALRHAIQNCLDDKKKKISVGTFLSIAKLEKKFKGEL